MSTVVSMVRQGKVTATVDVSLQDVLCDIRDGTWRTDIEHIREVYREALAAGFDSKKAVAGLKMELPGVLFCGRFSSRQRPVSEKRTQHSGFICADLDHIEDIAGTRAKLTGSPYVRAVFLSPTGTGLKVLVRVEPNVALHAASWRAVKEHIMELTGLEIDAACSDVSRLCFVSWDPYLWENTEASEIPVATCPALNAEYSAPLQDCTSATLRLCDTAPLHNCNSTPLHTLHTATLHTDEILSKITAKSEANRILFAKHPSLQKLYTDIVEPRFQAKAHERNHSIVVMVPFLYRAVAKSLVLDIVGCFYDGNRGLFNDSRETHMKEGQSMLEAVAKTYLENLTVDERKVYDALPVLEQEAFRICRDLALLNDPKYPPPTFVISYNHLADRLGIHPPKS